MQKLVFVAPISVFEGLDILVSLHGNLKGVHFLKEEIPKETEVNCMGGGRGSNLHHATCFYMVWYAWLLSGTKCEPVTVSHESHNSYPYQRNG